MILIESTQMSSTTKSSGKVRVVSEIEHVLLRPGMYIGGVQLISEDMYVYSDDHGVDGNHAIAKKTISYVPGLQTLFEEILLNAFDQTTREGTGCDHISVIVDQSTGTISVENNGEGLPADTQSVLVKDVPKNMYIPEIVFGVLRSGTNYDDSEERVTGGTNGFGAKLVNICSSHFEVETVDSKKKKKTRFVWRDHMSECHTRKLSSYSKKPFTKISFIPDLSLFGITSLTDDIVSLMKKRLIDIGFASKASVKTTFNGEKMSFKNPIDYMHLYVTSPELPFKPFVDDTNERWTIGVLPSDCGFQQTSFVNGIHTKSGGRHVTHVMNKIVKEITDKIKKSKKYDMKPSDVKAKLHVFIRSFIVNPTFSSQTKESLETAVGSFGSEYVMSDKFISSLTSKDMVSVMTSVAENKLLASLNKTSGTKTSRLVGVKGLEDANLAGTSKSQSCKLILTEGLSAKTFAMSAITVIGRDRFGIFPLKGKLLNTRAVAKSSIIKNVEILNIIKILGLKHGEKYTDTKPLRYGGVILLVDADQDGNHICGLLMNFFHYFWPELIGLGYINLCSTPIVKVSKKDMSLSFMNLNDFKKWEQSTPNHHTFKIKYYKGLGTSTASEAKECLSNIDSKLIEMVPDANMDESVLLAFNKKKSDADARKLWLTERYNEEDNIDRSLKQVTVSDFINKELVHFSYYSNQRALPNVVDGLKPSQRKILHTAIKYLSNSDMKVAQFGAKVAEKTDYHHGEASLMETIINMAQNYMGSNNINLLEPMGAFGTRLNSDDSASPRYIFTKLTEIAKAIFPVQDAPLLKYLTSDNMLIEPEFFVPVIPMVLVNGTIGIGTGFSTTIINYNPEDICDAIENKLNGISSNSLTPWYRGFKGTIEPSSGGSYVTYGVYELNDSTCSMHISELPVGVWTDSYKEFLEEMLMNKAHGISDVVFNHSDCIIDMTIVFQPGSYMAEIKKMSRFELISLFKLSSSLSTSNMHLFNHKMRIHKYESAEEILDEFFAVRLEFYQKRKDSLIRELEHRLQVLSNKVRFIRYVKSAKTNTVDILNMTTAELSSHLSDKGFDMLPSDDPEFKYLVSMPIRTITTENANKLAREQTETQTELDTVRATEIKTMWINDLNQIRSINSRINREMAEEALESKNKVQKKKVAKRGTKK